MPVAALGQPVLAGSAILLFRTACFLLLGELPARAFAYRLTACKRPFICSAGLSNGANLEELEGGGHQPQFSNPQVLSMTGAELAHKVRGVFVHNVISEADQISIKANKALYSLPEKDEPAQPTPGTFWSSPASHPHRRVERRMVGGPGSVYRPRIARRVRRHSTSACQSCTAMHC